MICRCIKKMGKRFTVGEYYDYNIESVMKMTYVVYDKDYEPKEITYEEFKKYFENGT